MAYKRVTEEIYLPQWVIEGVLAQSQRPGYPVDRPSRRKVQEWAGAVLGMGIKSVLCIIDYTQLAHYDRPNLKGGSLFGYYRSLGLKVEHIYAEDYKIPPLSIEELEAAWSAFQRLERPVLIHCSAGKDRTGAAVIYILSQMPVHGG
ncbi:MAG: tyrosine-protein phosphatase [Chloroflexota bacterium]